MNPNLAVQWQAASVTSCSAIPEVFEGRGGMLMTKTRQIPSELKCCWVLFLAISLFEKLDPFLLEYMMYPNCQKKSSKIKLLLSGLLLPVVWKGVMENLLTCTILAPSFALS